MLLREPVKNYLEGLKMMSYQIRVIMDQKGHIIDQKELKMYVKRQKMQFWDIKYLLLSGIFLSGIGGYPPPPLNGKSSCLKPLAEIGGIPTPLTDKIR